MYIKNKCCKTQVAEMKRGTLMPPKAKFTKQEIIQAALDIVRQGGTQALTARTLGARLGSSSRPIFTIFQSMEEVQQEVFQAGKALYYQFIKEGMEQNATFLSLGMQYIRFASSEPKLFQLLFMTEMESVPDVSSILNYVEAEYNEIFTAIKEEYGMDKQEAKRFYQHLWIYTHGIATLCVTKTCAFTEKEIEKMLYEVGESLLSK